MASWAWLTIAFPLLGGLVNGGLALTRSTNKRLVTLVGPGVMLAAFAVAVGVFIDVHSTGQATRIVLWSWMPVTDRLDVEMALLIDQLSTVMLLVVTGVGALIHIFSVGYMKADPGYARYFSYLNLFVVGMLVLVLGSSLPVTYIGWEAVGLCSYLLIGFWFEVNSNSSAGFKAFLMNRIGDFGVMIAMLLIWWSLGTLEYTGIAALAAASIPYGSATALAIALLLFLGCTGKSAQIPLYTWLPDAMAGPTPVSALIHAATMVTAGIFVVVRTGVLFTLAPLAMEIVAITGAVTAFFAATIALKQNDIKKVLAYSTVSQLGYMFLAVGSGAWTAGIFHLVTHAFFKALLFLGAGSVIHAMHEALHHTGRHDDAQDMRNMGGLRHRMPWTFALMGIATLAIAGIPPLAGFFSKDEILALAFVRGQGSGLYLFAWGLGLAAALMTAFYMARLMTLTFLGEFRGGSDVEEHIHEAPAVMTVPLTVLGGLTVAGGLINLPSFVGGNHWLDHWLEPVLAPMALLLEPLHPPSGNTELLLVAGAVAIAVIGLTLGFLASSRREIPTPANAPQATGFARVLANKYYVDEIYQRAIVNPTVWFSRVVLWRGLDAGLIDRLFVGGTARLAKGLGWAGSQLQNGQVAFYVTIFTIGVVLVLRAVMTGGLP